MPPGSTYGGANTVSNVEEILGTNFSDQIAGSAAAETFNGGGAADTFLFTSSFGHDTIAGFAAGAGAGDVIKFATTIFANFAAVTAHATDNGTDTLITFDATNSLTLKNVLVSQLGVDDFVFV